mmetsp:Transcript_8776/g.19256  ORF Transcript_8776/g.19256 Transcript_8776/m.19256 type:complete len:454 (-) Transcript_8776:395-1756(-)
MTTSISSSSSSSTSSSSSNLGTPVSPAASAAVAKSASFRYSSGAIAAAVAAYHSQALRDQVAYTPVAPSYRQAQQQKLPLPDLRGQRGAFEADNLKLHLCNSVFEAYSASYLTTKAHMLHVHSEGYNLTWVNCEMASFIHMKSSNKFYNSPQEHGVVMQSLDVLDFGVIHLSAFERSSNKHRNVLWGKDRARMQAEWHNIDPVIEAGRRLQALNDPRVRTRNITYSAEAQRTVVVMPFLGGAMGAGHSKLGNRYEYLRTCFWSLYEHFPHIVAGVSRQEDVDWCMHESGLPFMQAVLLDKLPKAAGLPVGLTQQVRSRLLDGTWDFDFVFFTESDQILVSRELQLMYTHLKTYPGHMMLPHRLMPYSSRVMGEAHLRDLASPSLQDGDWALRRCCLPRQNCVDRKDWLPLKDPRVPVINFYGLLVPLGNVNFLQESFRSCSLGNYGGEQAYCP